MVKSRLVVGAHYGFGSWLVQRASAAVMTVYTVIVLGVLVFSPPTNYVAWKNLFSMGWMRAATLLFFVSLLVHAWVGMRDVLMDYCKPTGLRLSLQVVTIMVLVVYAAWAAQILWR